MELNHIIWDQISKGDEAAYQEMYFHFYKRFYVYGQKLTPQFHLVEDAIQEVMIYIWQKRDGLSNIKSPGAYFFTFFRNALFTKMKKQSYSLDQSAIGDLADLSPEELLLEKERGGVDELVLKKAFNQLTPRQFEAVFLRYYQQFSYEEIATVMGITVKATYKLMARSLNELKNFYLPTILLSLIVFEIIMVTQYFWH